MGHSLVLWLARLTVLIWFLPLAMAACSDNDDDDNRGGADGVTATSESTQPQENDEDGDGVADDVDQCPGEKEDQRWSAEPDGCKDGIKDLTTLAVDDIGKFWEAVFTAQDVPYMPPEDVAAYDGPVMTGCGETVPNNAFYCNADHSIYFDAGLLEAALDGIGDFGPVFIIAHEWGHLVQANLGQLGDPNRLSIQNELQADCFAGVYAQGANERQMLEEGDLEEAAQSLLVAGDPEGTPWYDPQAHGTSEERLRAFEIGFEQGLPACEAI